MALFCSPGYQTTFEAIFLSVNEMKFKIDFQDGCYGCHLGFRISKILAIFDLQITLLLPTKFGVK